MFTPRTLIRDANALFLLTTVFTTANHAVYAVLTTSSVLTTHEIVAFLLSLICLFLLSPLLYHRAFGSLFRCRAHLLTVLPLVVAIVIDQTKVFYCRSILKL
ncbi:hypothetical protein BC834DRAFT_129549 [Gloeopeniophorella convolvens]|nr:hypothetical protein BC834DRAFT_129549 [Gloeopeniophorella convolvens]